MLAGHKSLVVAVVEVAAAVVVGLAAGESWRRDLVLAGPTDMACAGWSALKSIRLHGRDIGLGTTLWGNRTWMLRAGAMTAVLYEGRVWR